MECPTIISKTSSNPPFWMGSCCCAAESSYGWKCWCFRCCDYGRRIHWQFSEQLGDVAFRALQHKCRALSTTRMETQKVFPRKEWLGLEWRMTKVFNNRVELRDAGKKVDAGMRGSNLASGNREVKCASFLGMEEDWILSNDIAKVDWQASKLTQSPAFINGGGKIEETLKVEGIFLSSSDDGSRNQVAEDALYQNRKHESERRSRQAEGGQPVAMHNSQLLEMNYSNSNLDSNFSFNSHSPSIEEHAAPSSTAEKVVTELRNLPVLRAENPDDKLSRLLDEGEALLNEGQEGLTGRIEIGLAEKMLYEAADVFAEAASTDPPSLNAIGWWGNTLLVHGQLKFRLSQQLRGMIPVWEGGSRRQWQAAEEEEWREQMEMEVLERSLQLVCEECEKLLVEAGRKYRLALSLDRRDTRALYNWGLALCFRAQLIAEEKGALDADKIYLAAMDKFEALMSIDQSYAPGALLNWGLAMRDRSRLRPIGNKERVKLLLQAKELFQYALKFDPKYGQARGAVAACNVELKEVEEYTNYPNEYKRPSRSRKPWWNFW